MTSHNPQETMRRLQLSIESQAVIGRDKWRDLARDLGPVATSASRLLDEGARELRTASDSAAARIRQLRADDLIPDAGRQRLIGETLDEARKARAAAKSKLHGAQAILEAEARTRALPRLDPKREQAARQELQLLCSGSEDPASVLIEAAKGDGELAGCAVSSYGESLLRAKGVPNAKELHKGVCDAAIASARKSSDPRRQTAAAALAALTDLRKTVVANVAAADWQLKDEGFSLP